MEPGARTDTLSLPSPLAHHLTPVCAQPLDPGPLGASPAHRSEPWGLSELGCGGPPFPLFPMAPSTGEMLQGGRTCLQGPVLPREPDSAQMTPASYITTCPSCHFLPPHTTNMQCPHGPTAHGLDSPSQPSPTSWTRIPPPRAREEGSPGGALQGRRWAENLQQQWKMIIVYPVLLPSAPTPSKVRGPASAPWTGSPGRPHKGFGDTVRLRHQEASPQHVPSSPSGSCSAWRQRPQNSPPEAGTWVGLCGPASPQS